MVGIHEKNLNELSLSELEEKLLKFKSHNLTDDDLPLYFAIIRDYLNKTHGIRLHDTQLHGAFAMINGNIAEMQTGEGKTLVAVIVAIWQSLQQRNIHVVTTNDYLAKRDFLNTSNIYEFFGVSVSYINEDFEFPERYCAYQSQVVYLSNSVLGFDYLRSNLALSTGEMLLNSKLDFAIIDEIDSVLIDDARTPLVLSAPVNSNFQTMEKMWDILKGIDENYLEIDNKRRIVTLNEKGADYLEAILVKGGHLKSENLYSSDNLETLHSINQLLHANEFYERDIDYFVENDKVILVDTSTGRAQPDRRLSNSLHQALEIIEECEIQAETEVVSTISYQNFVRNYNDICGMTGTAQTSADEFKNVYGLKVVTIPRNKPSQRIDHEDVLTLSHDHKMESAARFIQSKYQAGQPVLVGTQNIKDSQDLKKILENLEVPSVILNAKQDTKEAEIIGHAGVKNSVTISTNMAGRGTDIVLGGNRSSYASEATHKRATEEVKALGGLCVVGVGRNDSKRIDNQLIGRSGRQGDEGESIFFISVEDEILKNFPEKRLSLIKKMIGATKSPVNHSMISKGIYKSQRHSELMDQNSRENLLKYDNVIEAQRRAHFKDRLKIVQDDEMLSFIEDIVYEVIDSSLSQLTQKKQSSLYWNHELIIEIATHEWFLHEVEIKLILEKNLMFDEVVDEFHRTIMMEFKNNYLTFESRLGPIFIRSIREIILETKDHYWSANIRLYESVRRAIHLYAYAQRQPIDEFKNMTFEIYENLNHKTNREIVSRILSIDKF